MQVEVAAHQGSEGAVEGGCGGQAANEIRRREWTRT